MRGEKEKRGRQGDKASMEGRKEGAWMPLWT